MKTGLTLLSILSIIASLFAFTVQHDMQMGGIFIILSIVYYMIARIYYQSDQIIEEAKRIEQHDQKFQNR